MLKKLLLLLFLIGCSTQDVANNPDGLGQTQVEENLTPDFTGGNTDADSVDNSSEDNEESNEYVEGDTRILFVGNSLTYFNDLPKLVDREAARKGHGAWTTMLAYPNYAILDHWADGKVQNLIEDGDYDFVVIQQGPSSQAFGREVLFEYGKKLSDLCRAYDAQLAFFMVWPSREYYYTFDGVITNHREAAIATGSMLCPVGEVWKKHFDETSDFSYYGPDGFHPSLKGSEVAAEVIVKTLFVR